MSRTTAVFFDVDFTLIHPGPRFQGAGYRSGAARHGIELDAGRFEAAVAAAAPILECADPAYDADVFVRYGRRIIELMGGEGARHLDDAARELYDDWALDHHFSLYDDVIETFETLRRRGIRVGLISNSHRPLVSFQSHFALEGLVSAAISSSEHGYMKPHPEIFRAALELMAVPAAEAVMVGDSLAHDVDGARAAGMRAVLLARGPLPAHVDADVVVIRSLRELPELLTKDVWSSETP